MKLIAIIIMILYLAFVVLAYAIFYGSGESGELRGRIISYQKLAPLVYITLLTAAMMTAFTGSAPLVMLGAAIFGKYLAFLYSMIAAVLATNAAYLIGKIFGKNIVRLFLPEEKVRRIGKKISGGISLYMLILLRAVPHPLYDAVSYASGFARVPFLRYFVGTALGLIPAGAALCFIGEEFVQRYLSIFLAVWILLYGLMVARLIRLFRTK